MKINKENLVQLLVEKTGMEKDEIASQLDQLIQRIVDAAQRGKALEIKEFGLFYFNDDGDLQFEPSTEFSTEINFKYAGMEPIEIKPPRDTSMPAAEAGDDPEMELDDDPFAELVSDSGPGTSELEEELSDPAPEKEKDKNEQEPVPPVAEPTEPATGEDHEDPFGIPDEEDPFAGLDSDPTPDPAQDEEKLPAGSGTQLSDSADEEELAEEEKDNSDSYADLLKDASSRLVDEIEEMETAEKAAGEKEKSQNTEASPVAASKQQKKDPITLIIGVILAFVLIAAGYFIFMEFFQDSPPQASVATATMEPDLNAESEPEPEPENTDADQAGITPRAEPEELTEVTESELPDENDLSAEVPDYGLTGQVTEKGNDGFSIVVFSYNREDQARNTAADLSSEGYRVLVTNRNIRGNTVWRVSLGQFPDIEQALEQAKELPSPYNTENFIQRIQTN